MIKGSFPKSVISARVCFNCGGNVSTVHKIKVKRNNGYN